MDWLTNPDLWLSLLTLTTLEIVLGIDNLVFIAVLVEKLPESRQASARRLGIGLALATRLVLLSMIVWIVRLTFPVFSLFGHAFSWRDLILLGGGAFLLYKGTREIHENLEGEEHGTDAPVSATFAAVVVQIALLDIVFSLDSVITAVGMTDNLAVMVVAVVIAMIVMLVASRPVSAFIERHPTIRMLALSFLLLIGMVLVADGFGFHVPRGYIYAAMGFSIGVEMLNLMARRKAAKRPIHLKKTHPPRVPRRAPPRRHTPA